MKLSGFLDKELIAAGLMPMDKEGLIDHLLTLVGKRHPIGDHQAVLRDLMLRERQSTTGIGCGIAIPHAIVKTLPQTVLAMASVPKGMDFHAVDNFPVHVIFLLLSPPGRAREHIKLLARISRICSQPSFIERLKQAANNDEVIDLITREDSRHIG